MNPFLYSTVARPLSRDEVRSFPPAAQSSPRHRSARARRVARSLGMAGLAAVAWSTATWAVDLNTATIAQLQGVRGIGPKTAQIIHQERERGGRYTSFEDLSDRVRGIGPKRAETLRASGLTIGEAAGTSAAPQDTAGAKPTGRPSASRR